MAIVYFLGALSLIFYNIENIVPSFISIFADVFSGSAAVGGFLGANFAFAFNRGVNRGLFSNEAGQGSAPIAHAAARAHEPVSEGMVAILEPFIDTIIICTVTGLVLLSSGAWADKYENDFEFADIYVMAGTYDENNPEDKEKIRQHIFYGKQQAFFDGELQVVDGKITSNQTIICAESFAEDVTVLKDEQPFTGSMAIINGSLANSNSVIF